MRIAQANLKPTVLFVKFLDKKAIKVACSIGVGLGVKYIRVRGYLRVELQSR